MWAIFAPDIYKFLVQGGDLPVEARRAFKRVLVSKYPDTEKSTKERGGWRL